MQAGRLAQQQEAQRKAPGAQPVQSAPAPLQAAIADPAAAAPEAVQALQQQAGNQAVLDWMKRPAPGQPLDANFSGAVGAARGSGQALPDRLRAQLEGDLHADFVGVRLHVDEQADQLNRQIEAKAFTVGSDIFFQRGAYAPHTPEGKRTLRHELSHVVQQKGKFSPHLRLGPANDAHEQEANRVSQGEGRPQTGAAPAGGVQRILGKKNLNIPAPEQTQYEDDDLDMKAVTGKGNVNPVFKVTHPSTGPTEKYFKPNPIMDNDEGGKGQATHGSTPAARAVASSRMDQWLGLGAMAKEGFAQYDVQDPNTDQWYSDVLGGESEAVEGKQIQEIMKDPANSHDFSNPETQKGLANIQLEDVITGQSDRHWGNIMINQKTGKPKAIDEDIAFGASYQDRKITELQNDLPEDRKYQDPEALRILSSRGSKIGQYNVGLPSHIDIGAAKAMLERKAEDLPAVLNSPGQAQRLDDDEIKEAQARFKLTKHYVKAGIASSANPIEMLKQMGVTDEEKAGKWAEKWKGRWNERYKDTNVRAPKIVSQWNQQTFQEQVHGDVDYQSEYLTPISQKHKGYVVANRGHAFIPSSYTQRSAMEQERFKNPFIGAATPKKERRQNNDFLRARVPPPKVAGGKVGEILNYLRNLKRPGR